MSLSTENESSLEQLSEDVATPAVQFIFALIAYGVVMIVTTSAVGDVSNIPFFIRLGGLLLLATILGAGTQRIVQLALPFKYLIASLSLVLSVTLLVMTGQFVGLQ